MFRADGRTVDEFLTMDEMEFSGAVHRKLNSGHLRIEYFVIKDEPIHPRLIGLFWIYRFHNLRVNRMGDDTKG